MLNEIKGILGKKELCPFCFEYFQLRDTPFRCSSPMKRCAPAIDLVLQKYWEDNRPVGKVLDAKGRFVRKMQCKDCGLDSKKRLCPNCHSDLPHTTGDYKNYIFAVIGAKEAGKSHYLAVLIEQIKKQIGPDLDMLLEPMNDETIHRYRNDFYNPVFKDGRVIKTTVSAQVDRKVQRPLVYSLTFSGKNILGRNSKNAIIIVFFDTAGEDLNDEDVMSTVNKYIYRSNGILLLIDPLQLLQVRDKLDSVTDLPSVHTETSDIMIRVTRLIQKGLGLKVTDNISIPLAVTFSKFDALQSLVDEQFQLNMMANHKGGFDSGDFNAINSEMMALLDEWGGQDLLQQVRTRYLT